MAFGLSGAIEIFKIPHSIHKLEHSMSSGFVSIFPFLGPWQAMMFLYSLLDDHWDSLSIIKCLAIKIHFSLIVKVYKLVLRQQSS